MTETPDRNRIEEIVREIPARFRAERLTVWKCQVVPRKNSYLVRVFLDRDAEDAGEPIGHVECALASRFLIERFERVFGETFDCALEVGSPGVDRPLESPADFRRFRGKRAKLTVRGEAGFETLRGALGALSPDGATLEFTPDGKPPRTFRLADVAKANLTIT